MALCSMPLSGIQQGSCGLLAYRTGSERQLKLLFEQKVMLKYDCQKSDHSDISPHPSASTCT